MFVIYSALLYIMCVQYKMKIISYSIRRYLEFQFLERVSGSFLQLIYFPSFHNIGNFILLHRYLIFQYRFIIIQVVLFLKLSPPFRVNLLSYYLLLFYLLPFVSILFTQYLYTVPLSIYSD